MRIVSPSVEVLRTGYETEPITPEQFIEKVGRTCYKSEDKITAESAPKFVHSLLLRGHEAMIEHWTLIFRVKDAAAYDYIHKMVYYAAHPWNDDAPDKIEGAHIVSWETGSADDSFVPKIRFTNVTGDRHIVSGNIRSWRDFVRIFTRLPEYSTRFIPDFLWEVMESEPQFFGDLMLFTELDARDATFESILTPITVADLQGDLEHLVHHDVTLKFICDRGVSHELVRHRAASFAQESTRYCNYSSGKYGAEITVVRPSWCAEGTGAWNAWLRSCLRTEDDYVGLVMSGAKPQEARSVLNNSLKTEVVVTGPLGHWYHFFDLRCGPEAQPDMREVACMARDLLQSVRNAETDNNLKV